MSDEPLVRLRHVYKVYRVSDTGVVALGGVSLDIPRGEFLAVVGPSGAGKSTILNLVGGLDRASAGEVEVDGRDLGRLSDDELTAYRATRVGFVWQGTARNLVPYLSVRENVRLPAAVHRDVASARRRDADELLALVGLADRARPPAGAALRRRAAARGDRGGAGEHAADPAGRRAHRGAGLRVRGPRRWTRSARVNHEFGVTIVMVTHDLAAARRADRRIRVRDGRLLHEGTPVDPIGPDGRVRLPDDVVAALGGVDLEAELTEGEVRLRRRSETGHA